MKEYRLANCLGLRNVETAINEMRNDDPNWRVHTLVVANVEEHQVGHHLQVETRTTQISRYTVLFERDYDDPSDVIDDLIRGS